MSSDVIFLQAKWSKVKERVEGDGKAAKRFKRIKCVVAININLGSEECC